MQQLMLADPKLYRLPTTRFSLSSFKPNQFTLSSSSSSQTTSSQKKVQRWSIAASYKPSVLSHTLLHDNTNYSVEMHKEEELEKEVRNALRNDDAITVLELIDDIQKLGLSNRFEEDTYNTLRSLSQKQEQGINGACSSNDTLHAVSLYFRLRRQHGFDASQGCRPS